MRASHRQAGLVCRESRPRGRFFAIRAGNMIAVALIMDVLIMDVLVMEVLVMEVLVIEVLGSPSSKMKTMRCQKRSGQRRGLKLRYRAY